MDGCFLRFYIHEGDRLHGRLAWEWLLEQACKLGIRGGSAFKAMAGFGTHHVVHEQTFFELAGSLTVEVEFVVTTEEADRIVDLVRKERLRAFSARIPARFELINPGPERTAGAGT